MRCSVRISPGTPYTLTDDLSQSLQADPGITTVQFISYRIIHRYMVSILTAAVNYLQEMKVWKCQVQVQSGAHKRAREGYLTLVLMGRKRDFVKCEQKTFPYEAVATYNMEVNVKIGEFRDADTFPRTLRNARVLLRS